MKHVVPMLWVLTLVFFFTIAAPARDQTAAPATETGSAQSTTAKPKTPPKDSSLLHPETLKAKAPEEFDAKFVTSKGEFVIHVKRAWAPLGADRFYNLVKHHFYDGASLFRVVSGFVVQFGLGPDPAVNKAWDTAKINDDPVKASNKPGFVTYAMAGPNTRTTQIFINLGSNARLDTMGFAPFGEVTSGMDVVKQFYADYADQPTNHQGEITNQGKAYLDKNFPKLDSIKTAVIVAAPAASASGEAAKPKD